MLLLQENSSWPSMTSSCWMEMSLVAQVQKPVPVVQHGGIGSEKGWNSVLLHRFLQAQCAYQKVLIPAAMDTGSAGKHGGHHTFLNIGEMRLLFIHSRVQYLFLNNLDDENMDEFKYRLLCDYCEMNWTCLMEMEVIN